MDLKFNNETPNEINYNGYEVQYVYWNNDLVWKKEEEETHPKNEIWYTTTNSATTTLYTTAGTGTLVSNTYSNGKGVMKFSTDLTELGASAFQSRTTLKTVELPKQITKIGQSAFSGCTSLIEFKVPDSTTYLDNYCFRNCYKLSSITWGNQEITIKGAVFVNCSGLTSINQTDNINDLKMANIGDGYEFSGCTKLKNITLRNPRNNGVIIGQYGFAKCTSLSSVTIYNQGDNTPSLFSSRYTFSGCTALKEINIHIANPPKVGGNYIANVFNGCPRNGVLHVPNGCKSNYSGYMLTSAYYLGYYGWTISDDLTI